MNSGGTSGLCVTRAPPALRFPRVLTCAISCPSLQLIDKSGYQAEVPDVWLTQGNPWEIPRQDIAFDVCFGGKTVSRESGGKVTVEWMPAEKVALPNMTTKGNAECTGRDKGCFACAVLPCVGASVAAPQGLLKTLTICSEVHLRWQAVHIKGFG